MYNGQADPEIASILKQLMRCWRQQRPHRPWTKANANFLFGKVRKNTLATSNFTCCLLDTNVKMAAETIMVNTVPCIVQHSAFNCAVNLEKLGKATIIGFLNTCASPMELDLTVEILKTVWLLSFVLSNKNERRLIGFDFWPVSVHFRNGSSDLSNDNHHGNSTESIKVCFEFLKSGKYSCFLDIIETADISSMQCPVIATVSSRTASLAVLILICLLIFSVIIFAVVLSARAVLKRRRGKYKPFQPAFTLLPEAMPYMEAKRLFQNNALHFPIMPSTCETIAEGNKKVSTLAKWVQTSSPELSTDTGHGSAETKSAENVHLTPPHNFDTSTHCCADIVQAPKETSF
ncbi:hypothetical protein T02_3689 [Trichinella nativa]|uniref:Uncharacterized protein n=1 Tax=Trichinella nativa TaxID=6335 RepID=A0A0V1KTW7_9BILA|nr:hypothetical protein T02_3689 [Trichinella nativa]